MFLFQKSQKSDGLKTPKLDEENQELELQAEKERLKREVRHIISNLRQ